MNEQLAKVKEEIIDEVVSLKKSLQDFELPADAEDSLNNLVAIAQSLDDLNPDEDKPNEQPQ